MRRLCLAVLALIAVGIGGCSNGIYGSNKTVIVEYQGRRVFIPGLIPNFADGTNFGLLSVGSSLERTWKVTNQKASTVTFTGTPTVIVEGPDKDDFVLTSTLPAELKTNTSSTFTIRFMPTKSGVTPANLHLALVLIPYKDANQVPGVISLALSGEGDAPLLTDGEVELRNELGVAIVNGDDGPSVSKRTDFGTCDVDTAETKTYTYAIHNVAVAPAADINLLGTPRVVITGIDADQFTVVQLAAASIAAGTNTTFTVTFAPTIPGEAEATVIIINDDTDEAVYWFVIKGTGTSTT
jgi:hypothetical protein